MSTRVEVTEFYARIWNAGDFDAIRGVAHADFTFRGSLGNETRGHDGFIEYAQSIHTSLDCFHCEILACVCEGEHAFAKMAYSGRHVAPFFGFEPTGLLGPAARRGRASGAAALNHAERSRCDRVAGRHTRV